MSDPLDELRNEAGELREKFSPALHERVMRQLRSQPTPTAERHIHPAWRYAAVAAAVGLAVMLWPRSPGRPEAPTVVKTPDITAVDDLLANAADPLRLNFGTAGRPELAYLDHDAAVFGRFVMQQLNQIPR